MCCNPQALGDPNVGSSFLVSQATAGAVGGRQVMMTKVNQSLGGRFAMISPTPQVTALFEPQIRGWRQRPIGFQKDSVQLSEEMSCSDTRGPKRPCHHEGHWTSAKDPTHRSARATVSFRSQESQTSLEMASLDSNGHPAPGWNEPAAILPPGPLSSSPPREDCTHAPTTLYKCPETTGQPNSCVPCYSSDPRAPPAFPLRPPLPLACFNPVIT